MGTLGRVAKHPTLGTRRRCTERRRRFAGLAVLERILERVSVTLSEKMRLRGRKQRGRQEVHPRWCPQEDDSHRCFGVRCGKRKFASVSAHFAPNACTARSRKREGWEASTSAGYVSLLCVRTSHSANGRQRDALRDVTRGKVLPFVIHCPRRLQWYGQV